MDKKKILVVDDEPQMVELLKKRLEANNYEVITAQDGMGCLKKAIEEKPDLILLDILMPDINGFEVSRALKKNEKTKDIPIVMLTALGLEKDLSKGLESGAVCFLTKPFNSVDLISEIERAMVNKNDL